MSIRQMMLIMAYIALLLASYITFVGPGPPVMHGMLVYELFETADGHIADRLVYRDVPIWSERLAHRDSPWRWQLQAAVIAAFWLPAIARVKWTFGRPTKPNRTAWLTWVGAIWLLSVSALYLLAFNEAR